MDVRIGIQNVAREVVVESGQTAEEVAAAVSKALTTGGAELRLTDAKGRVVIVPAGVIGYVEIGAEEQRRVGFAHS
ncbi:hypothetical protein GCM10023081_06950 [Arthrobacter ginkgonis]|uniref:ATP-binding protein n=1 Tax=Arthrobacter ginkgonis TaxID=1630594 RepID=A0ABP7BX96_9MICC